MITLTRRHAIIGLAGLLIGCQTRAVTVKQPARPVPTLTPLAPTIPSRHFPNLASAAEAVLAANPPLIAFGEIHRNGFTTSTLHLFNQEILPALARHGYTDLVIEHLPAGAAMKQEIKDYQLNGRVGRGLTELLTRNPDRSAVLELLNQAKANGIELHGAHTSTLAEYEQKKADGTLSVAIRDELVKTVGELRQTKPKLAVYCGANHNNTEGDLAISIAPRLGPDLTELDLLPGDYYSPGMARLIDAPAWETLLPTSGVNLQNPGPKRYLAYLPPKY